MLTIKDDVSQWKTMTQLVNYINQHNLEITPFILDIGAADGKLNSNSWNLIIDNDWFGYLVEPNPNECEKIWETHKYDYKRIDYADPIYEDGYNRISVLNVAVGIENKYTQLYIHGDTNHVQLSSTLPIHNHSIEVEMVDPAYLLYWFEFDQIGVLSIDTEGNDYHILEKWMQQLQIRPQIIITESWPRLGYQNIQKAALLANEGYRKILQCGENEIFLR